MTAKKPLASALARYTILAIATVDGAFRAAFW
jgi:hypothetical protein